MSTHFEALSVSRTPDGVCEVTLTRPELLNRFDNLLQIELAAALAQIGADDTVRVVVLSSTGKAFSAGGDFALMRAAHDDAEIRAATVDAGYCLVQAFLALPQPIVVAVHGAAVGLGATVALLCDVVVAAKGARIADTHVRLGLVAGDGGCLVWPQAVGMLRARRYLLTGDALDAVTAHQFGLVTDLVDDPAETVVAAREIAVRIAALPPLAVRGTKRALNEVSAARADEVLRLAFDLEDDTLMSDDLLEGITAFQEGRAPSFTGR